MSQRHYPTYYQGICLVTGKRRYLDRRAAKRVRRRLALGDGERLSRMGIYRCEHCSALHIGHRPRRQRG